MHRYENSILLLQVRKAERLKATVMFFILEHVQHLLDEFEGFYSPSN